jgi:hypothetical protein
MRRVFSVGGLILSVFVLAPAARAADQEAINRAVKLGVAALKGTQEADGTWPCLEIGATALAGLTLLECDVPKTDPAVKKAAEAVRSDSVHLNRTYSLTLSILFLDRLGEETDVPLIESLTVRLLAGQNTRGGWNYDCPDVPDLKARRLASLFKQRAELRTRPRPGDPPRKPNKADDAERVVTSRQLTEEIRQQIQVINRANGRRTDAGRDDNSNTQFAVLALWVARRHGLPTEDALKLVDHRFRKTQNGDGGWDYMAHTSHNGRSTPTMTCAGLLGLAVGYGAAEASLRTDKPKEGDKAAKPPDPARDPAVRTGLAALGTTIGHPVGQQRGRQVPLLTTGGRMYYFLWSLERVGVAFGLTTIGGKDWYDWGAEVLITNQQRDGSWQGEYSNYKADTCFALLFLKRANFARDLSARLKGKLDQKTLRGGVGGESLKEKLTGGLTKPGESDKTSDAKEARPPSEAKEIEGLAREVVNANGKLQEEALTKLRDGKGRKYTEAILSAISQLSGEAKKNARKSLAERLKEESADKLSDLLDDRDVEIRRAAALACALKESKQHIPQLIGMLRDREPLAARAAWAALKNITGENFGPSADSTDADKDKAIEAWRAWWNEWKTKNGK